MKAYPSIGRGLKSVFYALILALVLTIYSVVSFFFPALKPLLPAALVLDCLVCCGLTAGTALCVKEDQKYLPALAFAIGTVVLSAAVPLSSYATALIFLSVLQTGISFLSLFTLWDRTSKLLAQRGDTDSAKSGDRAAVFYLFPCGFRYILLGRRIDADLFGNFQYVPFGYRLGLMLFALALVLYHSSLMLRALSDAAALLTYQTEDKS